MVTAEKRHGGRDRLWAKGPEKSYERLRAALAAAPGGLEVLELAWRLAWTPSHVEEGLEVLRRQGAAARLPPKQGAPPSWRIIARGAPG